ncbi:CocE/NonD family hydrolase [Pseudooceanicola nanhaiensis]|uniref:CocE/NonD family hydrolase n=1 Tax=Pseudooceanicola nanhaiensis TaxID=375761 RepID=UPI001CD5BB3B|nr:CocE/NonD family hydrolase [Pseudooceanicola nanhaiensis]MCA0921705.1 CocE/NonD family hydrolase [Pseudooceanicola nanhaiensis]
MISIALLGLGALAAGAVAYATLGDPRGDLWRLRQSQKQRAFLKELSPATRQSDLMIPMRDGMRLATDLYLPADGAKTRAAVLLRLPYNKNAFGSVRHYVPIYLARGYAVVVQDMRGRYGSEGVFAPYPNAATDGADTLDWITRQDWSDGQVAAIGCSALGESQIVLAAHRLPALKAIVPMGAGGAIGTAFGTYGAFGFFEGGIFALASGFGWFATEGGKSSAHMGSPRIDYATALRTLPLRDAVAAARPDPTDFEAFLDHFEEPEFWNLEGFISDQDRFETPALMVDNWYDGARETLLMSRQMRRTAPDQHVIIGPGTHCEAEAPFDRGRVGDLPVTGEALDFDEIFARFIDAQTGRGPGPDLPPYLVYVLGADEWRGAEDWPPPDTTARVFHLAGDRLAADGAPMAPRSFVSDPADPVPTLGGAICCTGDPDLKTGPIDQRPIEGRADLLLFTSDPLEAPLVLAGPMRAEVTVAVEAPDADLVLRLTDVAPDGMSRTIQEGALRLRYRNGFDAPELLEPGAPVTVSVDLRDIAYRLEAGHRLRLHVAGSSFPRLARNPQTGGDPYRETELRKARISVLGGRVILREW